MTPFRTRIVNVRHKNGPTLRVLPSVREQISRDLQSDIKGAIANMWLDTNIAGYALVVWDVHGDTGSSVQNAETSPFANPMLPALVEESVRRNRTQTMIDGAFGYGDDTA